jgi:hypothetical protein
MERGVASFVLLVWSVPLFVLAEYIFDLGRRTARRYPLFARPNLRSEQAPAPEPRFPPVHYSRTFRTLGFRSWYDTRTR